MAESNDSADEVLCEELLVLKSIYITELSVEPEDYELADKSRPDNISLLLHPATGMDESKKYVCMTLCFRFPPKYPDEVPEIMVRNPRGLGEENVQSLTEDMKKTAEERKGGPMLFELIEMAKDCLTEGNLPHCECAICLDHFEEGDNFVKTDCYHYYHRVCLARCASAFVATKKEQETLPRHVRQNKEENVFRCPMCRVPLTIDLDDLLTVTPTEEKEIVFELSPEIRQQQKERAARFDLQKAKGSIIDLEQEKNKFLVDENTVVPLRRLYEEADQPSSREEPEPSGCQQKSEEKDPAKDRTKDPPYRRTEVEKYKNGQLSGPMLRNKSRKSHRDTFAESGQGYSDYEDDYLDVAEDGRSHGRGRGTGQWGSRYRGHSRRYQDSRPSSHQVPENFTKSWRTDDDFVNSGQGYSDYEQDCADCVEDVRIDRHGGRGPKMEHRGNRPQRGGGGRGGGNNRPYHRDRRENFRDNRGGNSYKGDPSSNKAHVRQSREHLGDTKEDAGDRREETRHRKEDVRDRKEDSRHNERGSWEDEKDGVENHRELGKDRRLQDGHRRDFENGREDNTHDRASPRDQHRDGDLARKDQGRGWHRDNRQGRPGQQHTGQGQRTERDVQKENRDRQGQNGVRVRDNRHARPREHGRANDRENHREHRENHRERMEESGAEKRYSPREGEGHSRPRGSRNNPRDFQNDQRHSQRSGDSNRQHTSHRRNGNDHGSGGDDSQQTRDREIHAGESQRRGDHDSQQTQDREIHAGESRRRGDHDSQQTRDREIHAGESQRRGDHDSQQTRDREIHAGESRRRGDHDSQQTRDREIHAGESRRRGDRSQRFNRTADGERRHLTDGRSSQETDDSETAPGNTEHGRNKRNDRFRGDRTFIRGQGIGRWSGRARNPPPSSHSEMDATTPAHSQQKAQRQGHSDRTGTRPAHVHENGKEDWGLEHRAELKKPSTNARQGDDGNPGRPVKKDSGRTLVAGNSSREDRDGEAQPQRSQSTSHHQPGRGQIRSEKSEPDAVHDRAEKTFPSTRDRVSNGAPALGPPPGLASQGPPPGFALQTDTSRKPQFTGVPKPPGFS